MIREVIEWYSPKDDLPPDNHCVLVKQLYDEDTIWVGVGYLQENGEWYDEEGSLLPGDVVLWSELPKGVSSHVP
jgi:hypothetical protein